MLHSHPFVHPTRYEDRLKMPYTEAFINEVFRFGSITPLAVHANPEETTLGGYRIPKRTWVIGNIYGIHWDKKVRMSGQGRSRKVRESQKRLEKVREKNDLWEHFCNRNKE